MSSGQTNARSSGGGAAVEYVTVTLKNPSSEALPYIYFVDGNGELFDGSAWSADVFQIPKNSIVICFGSFAGTGAPAVSGDAEEITNFVPYTYFVTGNCTFTI